MTTVTQYDSAASQIEVFEGLGKGLFYAGLGGGNSTVILFGYGINLTAAMKGLNGGLGVVNGQPSWASTIDSILQGAGIDIGSSWFSIETPPGAPQSQQVSALVSSLNSLAGGATVKAQFSANTQLPSVADELVNTYISTITLPYLYSMFGKGSAGVNNFLSLPNNVSQPTAIRTPPFC